MSGSQCSRRRTGLEESGVIKGYSANLSSSALGLEVIAFVDVTLARHTSTVAVEFAELIDSLPDVQEAFAMTGEADYLLKVIVPDLPRLADVLNGGLLSSDLVQTVKSSIVLKPLKTGAELPLESIGPKKNTN